MNETFVQSMLVPSLVSIVVTGVTLYLKAQFDSKSHENKVAIDHEHAEKKK